tara:strand:+ start:1081 stop:1239 length:159 start_codon:yes stop_codon:yes gene_type:complete
MNNKKIISPCISVCKNDPKTGFCYGCARSDDEKKIGKIQIQVKIGKKKILIH